MLTVVSLNLVSAGIIFLKNRLLGAIGLDWRSGDQKSADLRLFLWLVRSIGLNPDMTFQIKVLKDQSFGKYLPQLVKSLSSVGG